jgi:hypothetical protein
LITIFDGPFGQKFKNDFYASAVANFATNLIVCWGGVPDSNWLSFTGDGSQPSGSTALLLRRHRYYFFMLFFI